MRWILIAVVLLGFAAIAAAQQMPIVPYAQPPGAMLPGFGGPMVPPSGGGTFPPPPTCSNSLDFSDPCNSQYSGIPGM